MSLQHSASDDNLRLTMKNERLSSLLHDPKLELMFWIPPFMYLSGSPSRALVVALGMRHENALYCTIVRDIYHTSQRI